MKKEIQGVKKLRNFSTLHPTEVNPTERGNKRNITSPLLGEVCFQLEQYAKKQGEGQRAAAPDTLGFGKTCHAERQIDLCDSASINDNQTDRVKIVGWDKRSGATHVATLEIEQPYLKQNFTGHCEEAQPTKQSINGLPRFARNDNNVRSTEKNLVTYCPSALVSCKSSTPHPSPVLDLLHARNISASAQSVLTPQISRYPDSFHSVRTQIRSPQGVRGHLAAWLPSCLAAFTLAEVLITLGVIGVVAAVTMPTLIQNHRNQVVETRLQKFYSMINQAIAMSELNNGDKKDWWEDLSGAQFDEDGNVIEGSNKQEIWFNKYLAPYLKILKTEIANDGSLMVYFTDGTALQTASHTTRDYFFYPSNPKKCLARNSSNGICRFVFVFYPKLNPLFKYHYDKGMEPAMYDWDGTESHLLTGEYGCNYSRYGFYCTAIIQHNGWKIPKDYPRKIKL